MGRVRSGPLAAWTAAWIAGRVSLDQAVDAVTGADATHQVIGLDGDASPLREVLVTWRRAGIPVRAVLPVPGDVRGLPGPAPFRAAALEAGESVHAPGLGIVPHVTEYAPSSNPTAVVWHAYPAEAAVPDPLDLPEAQYELSTAIRECASALIAADVAGAMDGIAEPLRDARRAGDYVNLPPGFPSRAVALLSQADRLQAVLDLALADPVGGAVDRAGMTARADALRPLATAVRRARMAAYNAGVAE
jgi:hypothetical protein